LAEKTKKEQPPQPPAKAEAMVGDFSCSEKNLKNILIFLKNPLTNVYVYDIIYLNNKQRNERGTKNDELHIRMD